MMQKLEGVRGMKADTAYSGLWRFAPAGGCARRAFAAAVSAFVVWGTVAAAAPVRNVILLIGDGMGAGQVASARCYAGTNLFFEGFPFQRRMTTGDAGGGITDSAAAATAMATGRKVYSGVVSLAVPGDGGELETLLEFFRQAGKSTGLVTTSYLTDATPACFGAHASNRSDTVQIASDYLSKTCPDVLLGGGASGLEAAAAEAAGYAVVTDRVSLSQLDPVQHPRVCGLFGWGYLPYAYDGLGPLPSLSEMTVKALDVLGRDPDGFFLMAEGGLIDVACHGNDLARCVGETLALEAAVRAVVGWAEGRDDTLVLVAADHETGGLFVTGDNGPGALPAVVWATTGHTGASVTLYGWGVNAQGVACVADNTQLCAVARSRAPEPGEAVGIERAGPDAMLTRWATASGGVYRIEWTAGLGSAASWQPCATVAASGLRVSIVHTNDSGAAHGFYRMVPVAP